MQWRSAFRVILALLATAVVLVASVVAAQSFTNAVTSDEIWVQAGVHKPGTAQIHTYTLKSGVARYRQS